MHPPGKTGTKRTPTVILFLMLIKLVVICMTESYLHKIAKELLYKEIKTKGGFDWKSKEDGGFDRLIERPDYRDECILMEFPTKDGVYPDEYGCQAEPPINECRFCNWFQNCGERPEHNFDKVGSCGGYVWDSYAYPCRHPGLLNKRFDTGNGYCKCSSCSSFDFRNSVVHDIAAFSKGNVEWAIEIVNTHEPNWCIVYAGAPYPIYFVRAEDILKRVSATPVFVYKILHTSTPRR